MFIMGKFKIGDAVCFLIDRDTSGMSSCFFNADSYLNKHETEYYIENINAIITRVKGRLEATEVYSTINGDVLNGEPYNISKHGIEDRINNIKDKINFYSINEDDFFEGLDVECSDKFDVFFEIKKR